MSNRVPTFEEIREALKLPLEITVRHDAMGRVIKKNNYSDVKKVKKKHRREPRRPPADGDCPRPREESPEGTDCEENTCEEEETRKVHLVQCFDDTFGSQFGSLLFVYNTQQQTQVFSFGKC